MTRIPLSLRMKKRAHRDVASAQDLLVEELYKVFEKAVLHGGTAIWRCYRGNRFSEDLDFYMPRDKRRLDELFTAIEKKGFVIKKKKVGENSLYSNLEMNGVYVRLEALFKKAEGALVEYEAVDGRLITVYSLTPEQLIKEKVSAYLNRRKVRDLYDIFFLLRYVKDEQTIKLDLSELVESFKEPVDKADLGVLITVGIVPDMTEMLDYIKRWAR